MTRAAMQQEGESGLPHVGLIVGSWDWIWLVLDTLRFDVAAGCFRRGETPHFARLFPNGWEERHTPASFTYPAHLAFFAGFLPAPCREPKAARRFASRFGGSETATKATWIFDEADVVSALRRRGYHTVCIGGVGFFNRLSALSRVIPDLFDESHWSPEMGVTGSESTRLQFELAAERLGAMPADRRLFVFVNVSAIHQPNAFFLDREAGMGEASREDSLASHAAALRYVDAQLPTLLGAVRARGPALLTVCSDHGTLYGEDGLTGHRLGHPAVWTVPYGECVLA